MTNVTTMKPLRVETGGADLLYIRVPATQLEEVHRLLEGHRVRHWVDEHVISLNGAPEVGVIHLGRGVDAGAVQAILDGAR